MKKVVWILFVFSACAPVPYGGSTSQSGQKRLNLDDQVYEKNIKTVRLFRAEADPMSQQFPAVTRIGQWNLILEFDDLHTERDNYYFRIVHCNQNWTKSVLMDLDFLTDYNEFPINNFEFSLDTWLPYVHYWAPMPAVKLPGNYVVVVYRGSDKNDIVLSKRFMVFDPRISFLRDGNLISSGSAAIRSQQLNFTLNYKNIELINPIETVNVTVRQNQRWDNLVQEIKPSFLRENIQELEYRFFDDKSLFRGGNEFRFFDLRSLNYPGRNVAYMDKNRVPWIAYIDKDKNRSTEAYSQYPDYNGNFLLDNYDYRRVSASNYINVAFTLVSPQPVDGDVYVTGALTQWGFTNENLMRYDSLKKEYSTTLLLKQGWYDYQYVLRSKTQPPLFFEGSHFQTENFYEVFVYYRSFQPAADLLIGYMTFFENPR
ncbi:MAG: DUF5103 domain-containing protein [Cyclobacteriaceae bacterium]|nr:DUF5103 domain-containing protein [Cyclobacteriaceae bacterium]UYN88317.1 MAG: DUF5103 domain-containing protein [Cyclobacteriaceae bacterium]